MKLLTLGLIWLGLSASLVAGPAVAAIRFDQRIGAPLPLAARFTDASGRIRPLGEFFRGRPVVLIFGYARCPQLCSVVGDGTVDALRQLRWVVGREFDVISLSIDPTETLHEAARRQRQTVQQYGRVGGDGGWHFLTGAEPEIRAMADAAGFRYSYDPASHQYAHPSGFVVVTGAGVVSRYFPGLDFAANDVAAALQRAGQGRTGEPVFALALACFHGDAIVGRYGRIIWMALEGGVVLTLLALGSGLGWMLRQERRAERPGLGKGQVS